MPTSVKKAVLWDMDGTLIDSEHLHISALGQAMQSKGIPVPPDLGDRVSGMAADDVYDWLVQDFDLDLPFLDWIKIKYDIYMQRIGEISAIAPAVALWRDLARAGVAQAIVSNSDRLIVEANLGHLKLNHARMVSVSRNDVRAGKPDPEAYLRGAWLLRVDPEDCIVMEDSPTGATAGVAAGMTTFLVPYSTLRTPDGATKLKDLDTVRQLCLT